MAADDLEFLKDQVKRLNAVVAEYQKRHPHTTISQVEAGNETADTPWLVDKNAMSPLLAEYDANISTLKEQVNYYQREQKELRTHVDKLVAENKRLTRDLKEAVQTQLEQVDTDDLTPDIGDDQVLHNLQHQLATALQEKDTAMEMWQAAVQQVERLEAHLSTTHVNPRLSVLEDQKSQMNVVYQKAANEFERQIDEQQKELSLKHSELRAANVQITDLKRMLEDMRSKLKLQEVQKSHSLGLKEQADTTASSLHKQLAAAESKVSESERKLLQLRKERDDLQNEIIEMQRTSSASEQKAYDAALQVRDSVQMVENAMMEKDQAVQNEKQAVEEVDRLQASLTTLLEEAGARTRQEVDNVRKQCNNNIARLMEEIHGLEIENTEKQAQIERAIREKRAVESELEKIYQEGLHSSTRDGQSLDELNRRACDAERRRDEAIVKLDSFEQQFKRLDITCKQENSHLKTELEQLKDRLTSLNQEFELANEARVTGLEKIDELKRKNSKLQQERDAATRNMTKELSMMEGDLRRKEQEYEVKLQAVEDGHRHSMAEMRQMLASQQRMSAKWKEECNTITKKFEGKLTDLREELSREKKRVTELTKLLKESTNKTAETQHMLSEYTHNIKRMEERVREAENRAATTGAQMRREMKKERNIIEERKHLQRELERTLMESKMRSGSTAPEPLAVSDLGNGYQ